jgi:putative addiction module CopG family antidote
VKSGRYNNASEVVREALRRMKDVDERALRLAKLSALDLLTAPTKNSWPAVDQLDKV